MATATKARSTAKKVDPDEETPEQPEEGEETQPAPEPVAPEDANWLALQWLLPRAFPAGQFAHAESAIGDSGLPDEVQAVLREAHARATA